MLKVGKLLATQALSQTQKNVSEPQTGIEPATFWSPVRRYNHWATRTQMAERTICTGSLITLNVLPSILIKFYTLDASNYIIIISIQH